MKKLKVTFQLRKDGKKVKVEFPLKSPVSNPSINRVFDTKVHAFQTKNDAILYDYKPVETDVETLAYCKKEKKEVKVNTVYGGFDTPLKCKCGSKVYSQNLGKCECGKEKLWLVNSDYVDEELIVELYRCPDCGHEEFEPID